MNSKNWTKIVFRKNSQLQSSNGNSPAAPHMGGSWERMIRTVKNCLEVSMIMARSKWFKTVKPLQVDDVAVIMDENFKRNIWPKGIVVEVFKDKIGQVRSARVRTSLGTFLTRPVSKLAVLDIRKDLVQRVDCQVKLSLPDSVNGMDDVNRP